jgi:hypothetical protein
MQRALQGDVCVAYSDMQERRSPTPKHLEAMGIHMVQHPRSLEEAVDGHYGHWERP